MSKQDQLDGYSQTKWHFVRTSDQPYFTTEFIEPVAELCFTPGEPHSPIKEHNEPGQNQQTTDAIQH